MLKFRYAPEVRKIGDRLIPLHHRHLLEVEVRYFWGEEAPTKGNKTTLGTAQKVGGIKAAMAFPEGADAKEFFAITIYSDMWVFLDDAQREALIDHELCHCEVGKDGDGNQKLSIRQHDIEEFGDIVMRHGLWDTDLKEFAKAMRKSGQIMMDLNDDNDQEMSEEQQAIYGSILRDQREGRTTVIHLGQDAIKTMQLAAEILRED